MTTSIYYFSGTGNSYIVAKKLSEKLLNCRLIPIAALINDDEIQTDSKNIGFVFPTYYSGPPKIVYDFIKKLIVNPITDYIFAIPTKDKSNENISMDIIDMLLKEKGKMLFAGFFISFFSVDLPLYEIPDESEQETIFAEAYKIIEKISIDLKKKIIHIDTLTYQQKIYKSYYDFLKYVFSKDKKFIVDDNCISCGLCEQVCPVNDIILDNGKPKWLNKCQQCLACLHFCPAESIQVKDKTSGKNRYHHPDITVDDIIEQKRYNI